MCTPEPPKSANHQGQIDDRDFHDISMILLRIMFQQLQCVWVYIGKKPERM